MLSKNGSYFEQDLCVDGHYIITGLVNDSFCLDNLELTDVQTALHQYLRYDQGFRAVFFLDSRFILYCLDQQSYDILSGHTAEQTGAAVVPPADGQTAGGQIRAAGPLGTHRRRRRAGAGAVSAEAAPAAAPAARLHTRTFSMGRMDLHTAWNQLYNVMQQNDHCALVLTDPNLLTDSGGDKLLLELPSFYKVHHSVIVYLFRETVPSNIAQWTALARSVLLPRMNARTPAEDRVICLPPPNCLEISNLLNRARFDPKLQIRVEPGDIRQLGRILAQSCSRNGWGLSNLITRMDSYGQQHPDAVLSLETWKDFTDEVDYKPAIERLEALVGQERVKNQMRALQADFESQGFRRTDPASSSRFAPPQVFHSHIGFRMNVCLRGSSGTGKSTIADLLGQIYYDLGLLSHSKRVVRSAAQLVSGNVGHTAEQMHQCVMEAMGSELFIDEAYSLLTNQHGQEAINQLVNDISAYEGQFAVVLAGYPRDMDQLMRSNEGLPRRFPTELVLEDYSPEEIQQIFRSIAAARQDTPISFSPELEERMDDFFTSWVSGNVGRRGWGNAGACQNLLSEMCNLCRLRESAQHIHRPGYLLTPADVPENLQNCLAPLSKSYNEALDNINNMIGLSNVKAFLFQLAQNIRLGKTGRGPGNFTFSGRPGTGKTTVARRMGELLGQLHVLRRTVNNVTEVKAADLLNCPDDRLGTTLSELIEEARGGIFFLDEAPQLAQSARGRSIIRALVPLIDDPAIRADTCFILAGYPEGIQEVLQADAGLERRFPKQNRLYFQNYTAAELTQILEEMTRSRGMDPRPEYLQRSRAAFYSFLHGDHDPNYGNGGFIRDTYLPNSITAQTRRLASQLTGSPDAIPTDDQLASLTDEDRTTLTGQDLPADFVSRAGSPDRPIPSEQSAWEQVQALLGKEEIKAYAQLHAFGPEDNAFYGESSSNTALTYAIAGPVGCGRRTALRALAALWREQGLLNSDDVHYASKGDLEAGYVGQSAGKVRGLVESAAGGTLAICSPSSLVPQSSTDNSFGPEVVGALASCMTAHAADTSFVFLDSPEGLETFFRAYPSMRGQMARIFTLDDLTPTQMLQLFRSKTSESMLFEPAVEELLEDFFLNWVSDRGGLGDASQSWSNGAEVDRLIDDLKAGWSLAKGEIRPKELEQDGVAYSVRCRYILRRYFPQKMQRYLKKTTAVSESAMDELQALPGLSGVKASIANIQRRLRFLSKKHNKPGCYLYLGNPGVGKTTVAKLMGGVLKAAGVLSQGHVVTRTARAMQEHPDQFEATLKLARGGILFIDEAHQLGEPGNYAGNEIIKRLLTVLEDDAVTDTTCIILAGYPQPMIHLLQADEGLASRFGSEDSMVLFEDYDTDALMQVLDYMAARADRYTAIGAVRPLKLTDGYRQRSRQVFEMVTARQDANFGNARFVRTYLHDSLNAQLRRLDEVYNSLDELPDPVADLLTEEDIPARYRQTETRRPQLQLAPTALSTAQKSPLTADNTHPAISALAESVVYLEVYRGNELLGEATGTIMTSDGVILTCAHVISSGDHFRARIYCPNAPGGSFRWFDAVPLEPVCSDCDLAVLKMDGSHFAAAALAPAAALPEPGDEILMLGFPMGRMLNGNDQDLLNVSYTNGTVSSIQRPRSVQRCYCSITGLHGSSGSPVFSTKDQRMIGVFSGSVRSRDSHSLDELNFFHPIRYFWERFTRQEDAGQ